METPDFQPHPQTKPRTTELGPETTLWATQKPPLNLQVKEEPEVTEDPGEGRQSGQGPSLIGWTMGTWPEQPEAH